VAAFRITESGVATVWKETQTTTEWATLIGPKEFRVWVGTDIPGAEIPGQNKADTVVWRDAATGRELARSERLPRITQGHRGAARLLRQHVLPRCGRDARQADARPRCAAAQLTVRLAPRRTTMTQLSATDPAVITALAADAYIWGLGPQYVERFSKYNTIVGAPFNALKYGSVPAAWNNEATNAGNASVLYVSGFVNFDETPELVLTVPPSENQYYVVAYYDAYANTIGSIGTRTTPSDVMTSYLLAGPNSPYAWQQTAEIHGCKYPVMASDTCVNWLLIRVLANTLIDASDPASVPNVVGGVVQKFALNSLREFEANGHQPVYPSDFVSPPPTPKQIREAEPYQSAPQAAVRFFT
jgi:hypothetical protein